MVINAKHYKNKLEQAVSERAQTIGLAREASGFFEYVGYLHVKNEDETKTLYLITVKNERGDMGNFITKSDNVVRQINEIMDTVGDTPRRLWKIGFEEQKTKKGNAFISVIMTMTNDEEKVETEVNE